MYQSVMAQRQGSGSSGVGFSFVLVKIKELLPDKNICLAEDLQTGDQYQLGLNKRGETSWPRLGDTWVIDRSMGHWMLQCKVTGEEAPKFEGIFSTMDPDVLNLASVLQGLGLIQDVTTSGTIPAVTGSRNKLSPAVQKILDILASRSILDDQTTPETVPVEVWQTVEFLAPWSDFSTAYQAARYRMERNGRVTIEGLCKTSTTVSGTSDIFYLAEGYRPAKAHVFPSLGNGNVMRQLDIQPTGAVRIGNIGATAITISFTSISSQFTAA